jgi:hypothetical protein
VYTTTSEPSYDETTDIWTINNDTKFEGKSVFYQFNETDSTYTIITSTVDKVSPKYFLDRNPKFVPVKKGKIYKLELENWNNSAILQYIDTKYLGIYLDLNKESYKYLNGKSYKYFRSNEPSIFGDNFENHIHVIDVYNEECSFTSEVEGDIVFLIRSDVDIETMIKIEIYEETPTLVESELQYCNAEGELKVVDSYRSYKFESNKYNLDNLYKYGLNLSLSGIHFSKYKKEVTEKKDNSEYPVLRPYVYTEKDLSYHNLKIVDKKPCFKNIMYFAMDCNYGEGSRLMMSKHEIDGYTSYNHKQINTTVGDRQYKWTKNGKDVDINYSEIVRYKEYMGRTVQDG